MYQRRGFTLIELLVVIAIIGILATMVITSLLVARTKAYNATAQSDVTEMNKGVQLYETDDTNPAQAAPMVSGSNGNGGVNQLTNGNVCTSAVTWNTNGFCTIFIGNQNVSGGSTATAISRTATGTASNGSITYSIYTNQTSTASGPVTINNVSGYIVSTNLLSTGANSNLAMYYQDGKQYTSTTAYAPATWASTAQY